MIGVTADADRQNSNIPLPETEDFRRYLLILNDDTTFSPEESDAIDSLLQVHEGFVQQFSDINECVDFLTDLDGSTERAIVILSNCIVSNTFTWLKSIPQLHGIEVYGIDELDLSLIEQCHGKLRKRTWKNLQSLYEFIRNNTKEEMDTFSPVSFISATDLQNDNRQDPSFMYNRLIMDIILRNYPADPEDEARSQMIKFCRTYYADSPSDLKMVDEFESEYSNSKAIYWYSRECFVHKLVNKALWDSEPDTLYFIRYFLRHLDRSIYFQALIQSLFRQPMTVYRGQGMSMKDINRLKNGIGGLLSFRGFLSTSLDDNVALQYAEPFKYLKGSTSIVFMIDIDPQKQRCPFIEVGRMSYYGGGEQEILFKMGSVFRIQEIENIDENQWKIHLTSTDDIDKNLEKYTEKMQRQIISDHPMTGLVRLADQFRQYKLVNKLAKIFNEYGIGCKAPLVLARVQHVIGSAYVSIDDSNKAIEYLGAALQTYTQYVAEDDKILSSTYNNLGSAYLARKDYEVSLMYHKLAINCQTSSSDQNFDSTSVYCMNTASVYTAMENYVEAMRYQKLAIKYWKQHQGEHDMELSDLYQALGWTCLKQGDFQEAIMYHQEAAEVKASRSTTDPILLAKDLLSTGRMHLSANAYESAIKCFNEALEIQTQYLLPNNSSLASTYSLLASGYFQQKKFLESIPYYKKAIEIQTNTLSDDDPTIATSYYNLSTAYESASDYGNALMYAKKAVEQLQKLDEPSLSDLSLYLYQVGDVLKELNKYEDAIRYYKQSIEIQLNNPKRDSKLTVACYDRIGKVYEKSHDYQKALECYQEKLTFEESSVKNESTETYNTYFQISTIYSKMSQPDKAFTYIKVSLEKFHQTSDMQSSMFGWLHYHAGNILYTQGKYIDALYYMEKGLPVIVANTNPYDRQLATVYYRLASVYSALNTHDKAVTFYQYVLDIELATLSAYDPTIATTYKSLAEAYTALRQLDNAIDCYFKGIHQLRMTKQTDDVEIMIMQSQLDSLLKQLN